MRKLFTILCVFIASSSVQAQVVYTDITPDTVISATIAQQVTSYYIDLNNDNVYEQEVRHFNPDPANIAVELHGNFSSPNSQIVVDANSQAIPIPLNGIIGPSTANWGLNSTGIIHNSGWFVGQDVFIGMRFQISGQYHYGWARVVIPSDKSSCTIKDYAYNAQPGEMILAGQTSATSVSSYSKLKGFSITAKRSSISIESKKDNTVYAVVVFNMNGQKVYEQANVNGSLTIDMSTQSMGIYTVLLTAGKEQMGYKLLLQ